jgi:MSHA type pilus biogenesis protein MshL
VIDARWSRAAVVPALLLASCGTLRSSVPTADPWKSAAILEHPPEPVRPPPLPKPRPVEDARLRTPVTLRADSSDLRALLLGLAKQVGLSINVQSDVRGTVSANFNNIALSNALHQLLKPLGFAYRLSDDVLFVYKQDLETRIFNVDYLSSIRRGVTRAASSDRTLTTNISGYQIGGAPPGAALGFTQSGAYANQGGAPLTSPLESSSDVSVTWESNFWSTLHAALGALVFGYKDEDTTTSQPAPDGSTSVVDKEGRTLLVNPTAGNVLVRALPATLDEVEQYLRALQEGIQRQVVIEARILEVTLSDDFRFGVDVSNLPLLTKQAANNIGIKPFPPPVYNASMGATDPVGTVTFGPGGPDWQVIVSALRGIGDVRVISSPRISALSNQKAMVKVVRDRVFFTAQVQGTIVLSGTAVPGVTQFVPVIVPEGVLVDVIPHVAEDGTITMDIHPSFSQIINEKQAPQNQGSQPEVERRELQTTVRVRSDETIAIGGLFSERTTDRITGIPGLMYLPVLGYLFRRTETVREKTELIVLLTPRAQGPHLATEYLQRAVSGEGDDRPLKSTETTPAAAPPRR